MFFSTYQTKAEDKQSGFCIFGIFNFDRGMLRGGLMLRSEWKLVHIERNICFANRA